MLIEALFTVLCWCLCAYIAHEGVKNANRKFRELDMSPNISAIIGLLFGIPGLIALLLYGAIKVMVKRMLK